MRTTVLIVEGDAADRAALVRLLEGAGYAVDAVSRGQMALTHLFEDYNKRPLGSSYKSESHLRLVLL